MDLVGPVMLGLGVLFLGGIIFLGAYHPRSGADVLDWRPTRSAEAEYEMELQEMDDMLEAANERRRLRGEAELTEGELHARVAADRREADERRAAYLDDRDLDELLATTNARRRARGEPELTREEARARFGGGAAG